jgi:biotin-dependent carboxylase-like uncharacterized protein
VIEIVSPGPLATVQDLGRAGFAHLGVGRSGAFDRGALRLANRLVGNSPGAAAIEVTLGALSMRVVRAVTVAVTGADCPGGLDWGAATTLPAGSLITLGVPGTGVRTYLAVRGGIDIAPVLGSRSTDTLSGLGRLPLRQGDVLPVGPEPPGRVDGASAVRRVPNPSLRVVFGPRDDWFTAGGRAALTAARWTVSADSNRIGVRLDGPSLARVCIGELPSEPTLPGALQVPPDGRPILLGPDAPVTGGYPVIAVVRDDDFDAAAQLRPGDVVTFR